MVRKKARFQVLNTLNSSTLFLQTFNVVIPRDNRVRTLFVVVVLLFLSFVVKRRQAAFVAVVTIERRPIVFANL